MPLTSKGETILANLQKEYGADKGKQVLYAGKNAGTFSGIDASISQRELEDEKRFLERYKDLKSVADACQALSDECEALHRRMDAIDARRADAGVPIPPPKDPEERKQWEEAKAKREREGRGKYVGDP